MKKLDTDRIVDLGLAIREHKVEIVRLEAEMYAVLGVEPPAAPPPKERKPRSDRGRARERPNVMTPETPATSVISGTGTPPQTADAGHAASAERFDQPMDQPHHGHDMPDNDGHREPEEGIPEFLRRDKSAAERAAAGVEALKP